MLRRLTTTILVLAFLSTWSGASSLHIHAYGDHEHSEHDHGPAAHAHDHEDDHEHPPDPQVPDEGASVRGCDPGQHTLSVVFVCTPVPQAHACAAESVAPIVLAPDVPVSGRAEVTDVRAHGPPGLSQSSPRAPPARIPA